LVDDIIVVILANEVILVKRKSNSYQLDIQTHRKNPYGLLRNSYREDGKVKKETICRFSGLSLAQLRAMQAAIQGNIIPKDDFKITRSLEYGASFACVSLMKKLGLHTDIFSRPGEEWVRSCLAMIAGRLVYAGSKLSLSHCGSYSALWEICGINDDIQVDVHCYEAMDRLFDRQDIIQKKLAAKHLNNGSLILYDITSSYMEGEYEDSEIVKFGYNRDRKRGHKQIVIGLVCASDGCPVAVEVFKGNTKDETTLLDKIEEIQNKFGLEKIIFVGDRGMVTQSKYEQLNHELVKVITALTHGAIESLLEKEIIQIGMFDEKNIVEVVEGEKRYCLCKNPDMAKKETATRRSLLKETTEELDKIVNGARKTKYSKAIRAGKVVNKYKMGKFILFEGSDDNLTYRLDQAKIDQEAQLDGCYVIFTDVSQADMTAAETVANYKRLVKVEQAFRNMKTVRLEIRPVYHKTDDRIKCHVFICMLAYYLMWHMNQRLKPLFKADGVGADRKYTFDYIIESLKSIRIQDVEVCGAKSQVISEPTDEQAQILNHLGCPSSNGRRTKPQPLL
jgi:transposase